MVAKGLLKRSIYPSADKFFTELNEFLLKEHTDYRNQYDNDAWEYVFEKNFRKEVSLARHYIIYYNF